MSFINPKDKVLLETLARFTAEWLEMPAEQVTEGDVIEAMRQLRDRRDLQAAQQCLNHDETESF
jgi:hypothetical protein